MCSQFDLECFGAGYSSPTSGDKHLVHESHITVVGFCFIMMEVFFVCFVMFFFFFIIDSLLTVICFFFSAKALMPMQIT